MDGWMDAEIAITDERRALPFPHCPFSIKEKWDEYVSVISNFK